MPDFWLEEWWTKPANAADFLPYGHDHYRPR